MTPCLLPPHPEALWVSHHWRTQVHKCAAVLPNNKAGVKIIAFVVLVSPLILFYFNFFPSFLGSTFCIVASQ